LTGITLLPKEKTMAQVQAINTVASRRSFLSQAATGGTALALGATIPASAIASQRVPDSLLGAIEAHRAAMGAVYSALKVQTALEIEFRPMLARRDEDDPRWIANDTDIGEAWNAVGDAEVALLNIRPTTQAGILALLRYVIKHDADGEGWHPDLLSDDGDGTKSRHFYYFLVENVAETLAGMVQANG
jgi:hypothetical protein